MEKEVLVKVNVSFKTTSYKYCKGETYVAKLLGNSYYVNFYGEPIEVGYIKNDDIYLYDDFDFAEK